MKYRAAVLLMTIFFFPAAIASCQEEEVTAQAPTPNAVHQEITATPIPTETPGASRIRTVDGMMMVFVPGGTFRMGSTETEVEDAITLCKQHYTICNRWYYEREGPQHLVSVDGFWIDQTEVRNDQYRICAESGMCAKPVTCKKGDPTFGDPDKRDHPVVCVNWEEAQTYCEWAGGRLPTEAEWEYAFRGQAGLIYPWGSEFDGSRLNYCDVNCSQSHADLRYDDGYARTAPVESYPRGVSWVGAFSMGGNVSEWVEDWFGEYSSEAFTNSSGPSTGSEKMIKGCSWFYHPTSCRGMARPSVNPDTRFDFLGFRCAVSE